MYGIVNKSIEDLIKSNFGEEKWNIILEKSGIEHNYFISSEPYDDEVTFKLAHTIATEMNMSIEAVLVTFGEWWIIKTTKVKYSGLMEAGGNNLKDFLINLPLFHNRVILLFPKLTPPEFKISDIEENSLHLHYFSKREGLQAFVRGLIQGLGILFEKKVAIELLKSRPQGDSHEVFKISWTSK